MSNPFIIGQPLPPQWFVGHKQALNTILNRLGHPTRGSTSVIGVRNGRTSLLRYLVSDLARERHTALEPCLPVLFQALADPELNPQSFWQEVLVEAAAITSIEAIKQELAKVIAKVEKGQLILTDLRKAVDVIGKSGHVLLLAIDDFDRLMNHPNFIPPNDSQFFDRFRALCQRDSHGLAMVVTTSRSLLDLWKYPHGSIFYNIFDNVPIGRLMDEEVNELFERMLDGSSVVFSNEDKGIILNYSANLPVYIQYYASLIYEGHITGQNQEERKVTVNRARQQDDNTHEQLTRHLFTQMTAYEQAALKRATEAPQALTVSDKQLLQSLATRGGLPPGVIIPGVIV